MNPIDVDRHGYDEACDWLYEGNHVVFDALTVLADALSGSGGMAGNDRTGTAWATGYDEAAGQLCDAAGQLCAAIDKAANLTNTSLSNHQAADGASIYAERAPAGVLVEDPDPAHYGESVEFGAPSALGDNGGGPGWWHWIAGHTKGWLWPNADTDELRRIGSAWRTAGRTIQGADTYMTSAAGALGTQRSPEIAIATDALGDLGRHCDTIGGAMIDLGSACEDYATMVDEHHHQIEDQLASFIKWSIGLQVAGGIVSIFTVGAGEGGAQAGEAAMVARAGSKAASILSDLFTMVTNSDLALTITGRLEKALPALGRFLKAGEHTADLETAAVEVENAGRIEIEIGSKIEKQMGKRGWSKQSIEDTIDHPARTKATRDTRWRSDGTRNDDPATMYFDKDGGYVVRNDRTGDIVQVSNKNKPDWKEHGS